MIKEKIKTCLNSGFTPIACMLILLIVHRSTGWIAGAWPLRLLEICLCVLGLVLAVRTHTAGLLVVSVGILAVSLVSSAFHMARDLTMEKPSVQPAYLQLGQVTGSGNRYATSGVSWYDYDDEPITVSKSKSKCHVCNGSKSCKECSGTGRITIQKQGINLGGGGSTYNEHKTCPLCGGDKKCYWCNGTGYEPYG